MGWQRGENKRNSSSISARQLQALVRQPGSRRKDFEHIGNAIRERYQAIGSQRTRQAVGQDVVFKVVRTVLATPTIRVTDVAAFVVLKTIAGVITLDGCRGLEIKTNPTTEC